ncbi:hypothetical protein HK102_003867 [Quaeritorhiza haematococci]|nr:hypothetical protein HK102_003867 [Quaeritorhiza haematococci]
MKFLSHLLLAGCSFAVIEASQFDPHPPAGNPWFEGWYTRATDPRTNTTVGVIYGIYPDQTLENPSAYAALLLQRPGAPALEVYETFPTTSSISPSPSKSPSDVSEPEFQLNIPGIGSYVVSPNFHQIDFTFPKSARVDNGRLNADSHGSISLRATLTKPIPWGRSGEGPAGIASRIPLLKLQWFVYSLGSETSYTIFESDKINGPRTVMQGRALAHEEKNWGSAFPSHWIWAQGTKEIGGGAKYHLAIGGGRTPVGPIVMENAFLVGYRSPKVGTWNFAPQKLSMFEPKSDACNGVFTLVANDMAMGRKLVVRIRAPTSTFSNVACPTTNGFRTYAVESFVAVMEISAYAIGLSQGLGETLLESVVIEHAALEFGGGYRCGARA